MPDEKPVPLNCPVCGVPLRYLPGAGSDIAGRHVVHLSNTAPSRRELSTKLRNTGCNVDEDGTDWLTVGDLSA